MSELNKKAWSGLIFLLIALGVVIFLPAGTLNYWQGWLYLFLLSISICAITGYLMKYDQELLSRRVNAGAVAEKEKKQKIIQFIGQFAFAATYILPSLDHRFSWSRVPFFLILLADVFVLVGFFIVFLVFKENTFTSAIIEVDTKQTVISTGPYAIVRHPMYTGSLLALFATPLALGSYFGLLAFLPMLYVIIWRLQEEETYLRKHLSGYKEYTQKVPWRLLPGIY